MTICIAWKTDSTSFIVADSAISIDRAINNVNTASSFGEAQGRVGNEGDYVYENAFKIYADDDISICLSGDISFGNDVVELLLAHLGMGRSIEESISNTINNYQDFRERPSIQIIIASYDTGPKLHTMDNGISPFISDDNNLLIIGTPSDEFKQYIISFYDSFKKSWLADFTKSEKSNEYFLMKMLALMQIYGVHNLTFKDGIGGAYTGMLVNKSGVRLPPDICYVTSGESVTFDFKFSTAIYVEKNHFCIVSSETSNYIIPNTLAFSRENANSLEASLLKSIDIFDTGKFKYCIFLNSTRHSAVIVDMQGSLNHALLSIDVKIDRPGTIGFMVDRQLQSAINAHYEKITTLLDAQIRLIEYFPASKKRIELLNKNAEKARISKYISSNNDVYKFLIFEEDKITDWFYGTGETIFPFLKTFRNSEHLRVVHISSDGTELEYKNGKVTHPDLPGSIEDIFYKIIDKTTTKNLFIFEFLTGSNNNQTINILSNSEKDARVEAIKEIESNFNSYYNLTFVGKKFYHSEYLLD